MAKTTSEVKGTLTPSEARTRLPGLVKEAARRVQPGKDLLSNAVRIQPRGFARSAYLVPEVDLQNAQKLIESLEEDLEDIALVRMLEERTRGDTGALTSVDDLIRGYGFEDLLAVPGAG